MSGRTSSRRARPSFDDVPDARRRNMAAISGRDTKPERTLRRILHSLGYRFRLHRRDLPGRPDIVLPGRRKVIFINGCFWHRHGCRNSVLPRARREWWEAKLSRNVERDIANVAALKAQDWSVLTVWECEMDNAARLSKIIQSFLGPPGSLAAQAVLSRKAKSRRVANRGNRQ